MKIPKIEYDVYSRLNGSKLEKLDLLKCDKKIQMNSIQVVDIIMMYAM